jgi:hypothetical protein
MLDLKPLFIYNENSVWKNYAQTGESYFLVQKQFYFYYMKEVFGNENDIPAKEKTEKQGSRLQKENEHS